MPRLDVLKRIKDNVLIDEKIQILRLHFNYLKTALETNSLLKKIL